MSHQFLEALFTINHYATICIPQLFEYDFDLNNNLTKFAVLTPNSNNVTSYEYGGKNLPNTSTFSNGKTLTYSYDKLGGNYNITIDAGKFTEGEIEITDGKEYDIIIQTELAKMKKQVQAVLSLKLL